MKTVVIYKSMTGFTKKYAEWIAEELKADLISLDKIVNADMLLSYDIVIFGGFLYAAGIKGVNIIKNNLNKLKDKHVVIFATGASPAREELIPELLARNFTEEEQKQINFYYFRGGFDFSKLDFINKLLMSIMKWVILSTRNKTADQKGMLAAYSQPMDFTKKENINGLLEYVRSLGQL